jgi:DNA-binding MarR family transcriptional regulator
MENINGSIEVTRLFQEVMGLFRHNMKKIIQESGMSMPQGMIMGFLGHNKKMKITDLSKRLCLSNSTVSGLIDKLEAQEMVIRERSKEDKRVVYVSIAPKYEELFKNFHKEVEKNIEKTLSRGTAEELNKIFEGLYILRKLLNEHENDEK